MRYVPLFATAFLTLVPVASLRAQDLSPNAFLHNGVTAHRGFSTRYPENTLRAFRAALEIEADWLECDIFRTKDRQLVVLHDPTTERVGDKNLRVADVTYEELQTVDVAYAFRREHKLTEEECPLARVPLLSEVIELVKGQQKSRLSIQPKDDSTAAALELVQQLQANRWVGFNDGDLQKLILVRQFDDQIPVFWDRGPNTDLNKDIMVAREWGIQILVLQETGITADKVALLHEQGFRIGAWTVNAPQRMQQLLRLGVDRIYTDAPDELLRIKKLSDLKIQ